MTEPKNVLSVDTLRQRAMALLGRREYSLAELRQKLRPFASDGKRLEAVLADLVARDWQSDARFAESWVRSHAPRQGVLRLQQDLRQRGVSAEVIAAALAPLAASLEGAEDPVAPAHARPAPLPAARSVEVPVPLFAPVPNQSEAARAMAVWQKKFTAAPATPQERSKQFRFLMSRGFSASVSNEVITKASKIG
jgi:regulatory protein